MAKIKTVRLHSAKCIAMSGSVSSALIQQAAGLSSSVASATGFILDNIPEPQTARIILALNAGAAILEKIPGLVQAIGDTGNYPDQLYLNFGNKPGRDNRFWPNPGKFYEILPGQLVRFDGLRFPLNQPLDISLWEYDYVSGDDHLGTFAIEQNVPEGGHVVTVTSSSEASIYLVAYTVALEDW